MRDSVCMSSPPVHSGDMSRKEELLHLTQEQEYRILLYSFAHSESRIPRVFLPLRRHVC